MAGPVTFQEITSDESWAVFDGAAQRLLGMSGAELVKRWDAGELSESDSSALMQVIMLRPSGR
jgi:hypothetical protein